MSPKIPFGIMLVATVVSCVILWRTGDEDRLESQRPSGAGTLLVAAPRR